MFIYLIIIIYYFTSGSLISSAVSLMEVLDDSCFLHQMVFILNHTFLLFPKELSKIL